MFAFRRLRACCALLSLAAAPSVAEAHESWIEWLRGGAGFGLGGWAAADDAGLARPGPDAGGSRGGVAAPSAAADAGADQWEPLRQLLHGWEFTQNYAIAIGDARRGRLFLYAGGNFTMRTRVPIGSTSKWPSAMMFLGLVDDGTVGSLDDRLSRYLPWWTTDAADPRSPVTFRMLLSFTSGFGGGHPGEEANTRAARQWRREHGAQTARGDLGQRLAHLGPGNDTDACDASRGEVMRCARFIYENVGLIGTPGQVYSYNSNHLQLAAAAAVAASGLGIREVIQKYLVRRFGMHRSFYLGNCPDFGDSLITTGEDYERFLAGLLNYSSMSRAVVAESEKDYTPFLRDSYTLYGDYGFGHFLWCFDSVAGFTERCRRDEVHSCPGAFGFIPMIDRRHGYYFQVAAAENAPTGSYPLSGIPEYLAVALKPHVDAIMAPNPPAQAEHLTHSAGFLSLSVADVNYCASCVFHPELCS